MRTARARVAAGDPATGRALLDFVQPRIYSTSLDFSAIEELSATRERLNEKLAIHQTKRRGIDVKLEPQVTKLSELEIRATTGEIIAPSSMGTKTTVSQQALERSPSTTRNLVDYTKADRGRTFFDTGFVAHVSVADPFCNDLNKIAAQAVRNVGGTVHEGYLRAVVLEIRRQVVGKQPLRSRQHLRSR